MRPSSPSARTTTGWLVSLGCLCPPMAAQAMDPSTGATPVFDVRSEIVVPQDNPANLGPAATAPGTAMLSGAVRNTLWARRGLASVGVGVESPMGSVSRNGVAANGDRNTLVAPSLLVGVAVDTSPRSRLVLDTPLPSGTASTPNALNPIEGGHEVRLGFQIKPADPLKTLRAGQLFKVELSRRSQLALKPGSGGVSMSYSSKF